MLEEAPDRGLDHVHGGGAAFHPQVLVEFVQQVSCDFAWIPMVEIAQAEPQGFAVALQRALSLAGVRQVAEVELEQVGAVSGRSGRIVARGWRGVVL